VTSVSENWQRLQARVAAAAERAGRRPSDVTTIAVSKTFPAHAVQEAYEGGVRIFGENYVQEALEKMAALPGDIHWHMIGHLQTNKAKQVAGRFALIHSVDSLHVAREIDKQAAKREIKQPILVQVNIADEETKSGFEPAALLDAVGEIAQLGSLGIRGLMTIGPLAGNPEDVRWVFAELRSLRDGARARFAQLELDELSMGMSGDFEVAIEEGATLIRVGRAIFGERPAKV